MMMQDIVVGTRPFKESAIAIGGLTNMCSLQLIVGHAMNVK